MGTNERRIAIFGGSFDPIHHGHLIAARMAGEILAAERVRLIPTGEQPLKGGQHGASAADRAAMTELAVGSDPYFEVDRSEVDRPGYSYTVDTLRRLVAEFPDTRFSLLLGSDAAALFRQWREPEAVRSLAELVVYTRTEDEPPPEASRVITVPQIEISSTAVRERVRHGKSVRFWVPDAVAQYIETHALYRD